jgi:hypothetical protein
VEALDWALVAAGVILSAFSIVFLVLAKSNRAKAMSALLALGVALTLAHPFGMTAEEVTRVPADAVQRDPSAVNTARVVGLPAMPFKLFRRDKLRVLSDYETEPNATLRARSWVWPFLFTSSSELSQMCDTGASVPCWKPERTGPKGQPLATSPYARTLSLWSTGGKYWVKVDNPYSDHAGSSLPQQWVYRLRPAVTSWWGLGYWLLAAGIVLVRTRLRSRDGVATA